MNNYKNVDINKNNYKHGNINNKMIVKKRYDEQTF